MTLKEKWVKHIQYQDKITWIGQGLINHIVVERRKTLLYQSSWFKKNQEQYLNKCRPHFSQFTSKFMGELGETPNENFGVA